MTINRHKALFPIEEMVYARRLQQDVFTWIYNNPSKLVKVSLATSGEKYVADH